MNKTKSIPLIMMLLLSLNCLNAIANETPVRPKYERQEPAPEVIKDANQVEWVCYTPKQGKQLARVLVDYHTIWILLLAQEQELLSLKNDNSVLLQRVELWKEETGVQRQRGDMLLKTWKAEHTLRLEVNKGAAALSWAPWVTLAVVGAIGIYAIVN